MPDLVLEMVRADDAADPHAFATGTQHYLVRKADGTYAEATLRWDDALLAEIAAARASDEAAQRIGDRLAQFLAGAGWRAEAERIEAASRAGQRIDLVIRAAAAELFALPWEQLTVSGSGRRLSELPGVLLRYEWPGSETVPRGSRGEATRIRFAWSAAGGAVPAAALLDHFGGLAGFDPARDVVAHATRSSLVADLTPDVAVLHLLAHGAPLDDGFGIALNDGLAGAATLRRLLAPHAGTLRLVVLTACDSASAGVIDAHLGGLARALHRAGIEAVVGARAPLSTEAAIALTAALHPALFAGTSLDDALAAAVSSIDAPGLQLWARSDDTAIRPLVFRPYRGLLPFEARHRRFFFGRDAEAAEVVADLAALRADGRPRLLVIAGASGTGKSSVVRAGAIPLLRAADEAWRIAVFRPGSHPAEGLTAALATEGEGPLLVVVDQFEEVFTQTRDAAVQTAFARRLWDLARAPDGLVHVALTIRVDFLGRCGELILDDEGVRLDRVAYDEAHRVFVAQMSPEQLRAAIERPAGQVGLRFEPGLVDRILDDVAHEPGALPLLSYALDQLWQAREDGRLTQAAYTAMGGVAGALHGEADAVIEGLSPSEREVARRLLVRLVAVGVGAEDARKRETIASLRPADAAIFDRVLAVLVDARLLVRGEEDGEATVEVAHEALIRGWPTLQQWIEADREKLVAVAEIEAWVPAWRQYGALLDGDALGYAASVRKKYPEALSAEAEGLLGASEAALAAREARRQRRARISLAAAAVLGLLAFFSFVSWRKAEQQKQQAEAARAREAAAAEETRRQRDRARLASIVAGARTLKETDPVTAGLLLAELPAERPANLPPDTSRLVRDIAQISPPVRVLPADFTRPTVSWTRDGRLLVEHDNGLQLWNTQGALVRGDFRCRGQAAARVVHHPTRDWLVTAHVDGSVCRWASPDASPRLVRPGAANTEAWIALTPDPAHVWLQQTSETGGGLHIERFDPSTGESLLSMVGDATHRYRWLGPTRLLAYDARTRTGALHTPDGTAPLSLEACGHLEDATADGLLIGRSADEIVLCAIEGSAVRRVWADARIKQMRVLPDGDVLCLAPPMLEAAASPPGAVEAKADVEATVVWRCRRVPVAGLDASAARGDCRPTGLTATYADRRVATGIRPVAGTRFAALHDDGSVKSPSMMVEFGPWQADGAPGVRIWRYDEAVEWVDATRDAIVIGQIAQGRHGDLMRASPWGAARVSPDGAWVASPTPSKHHRRSVGLWHLAASEPRWIRQDGTGAAHFVGDERHLLVHGSGEASLVDLSGARLRAWSSVLAVNYAADLIATWDAGWLSVRRRDGRRARPDLRLTERPEHVSLGAAYGVVRSVDGSARVFALGPLAGPGVVLAAGVHDDVRAKGRWIVVDSPLDRVLAILDAATLTLRQEVDHAPFSRACRIGRDTLACDDGSAVTVRAIETGVPILTAPIRDVGHFKYLARGRLFVTNTGDALRAWSTADWTSTVLRSTGLRRPIGNFDASADGGLVVAEADVCQIWSMPDGGEPAGSVACHVELIRGLMDTPSAEDPVQRVERFVGLVEAAYDLHAATFNIDGGIRASEDGLRVVVGGHPHLEAAGRPKPAAFADYVAVHRVRWADLITYLRDRTTLCLTAEQRMIWLAEGRSAAQAAEAACKARSEPRSPQP